MQPGRSVSLLPPRLTIEPLNEGDLEDLVACRQDSDVARYQGWKPSFSMANGKALLEVTTADLPRPMQAFVEVGVTFIRVQAVATAWDSRCVHIRWTGIK